MVGRCRTLRGVKSTVEALEGNKVKVVVEVEEAEFEKDLDAAFRRLAQEVRLPGFRPGKAPRKVLEARIGQSYARDEAFREALPGYYSEAVKEHEVDVIAPPEIDITNGQEAGPVSFDAVVEIRPAIAVAGYDNLEIEVPSVEVSEDDIDEAVDRMRGGFSELETVDRPAEDGDSAVIDIEAIHEGEPIPGLTTGDYVYKVGSGAVVPEIDENLIGASAGDELEFTADHPDEDEDEELYFTITVKEIQETVLPEPTDEWVQQNSEFETLAELRADFESNIRTTKVDQANTARRTNLADAIAELVDDELVPDAMVDLEAENRARDFAMNLHAQGIDLETFQQITGQSNDDLIAQMRETAAGSAKLDLALRAVAEAEGLTIDDSDVDAEMAKIAAQVDTPVDEVRQNFIDAGRMQALRSDLLKSKALDWLTERANLVDEDGQPVDPDALQLPTQDEADDAGAAADEPASSEDEPADTASADTSADTGPAPTGEDDS